MFSRIRKRFTYANVAMTLALVFAMTGGAYAAKHYLITSTKQISPKVLKQLKGAQGPAGLAGVAGAQGPQGPAGAAGKEGSAGKEGPQGKPGEPGKNGENGKEGSPWTAGGVLPKEKTETGAWSFWGDSEGPQLLPLSFNIPLAEPMDKTHVHFIKENGEEYVSETEERKSTACMGEPANPSAEPGNLCVYIIFLNASILGGGIDQPAPTGLSPGASTTGALLFMFAKPGQHGWGTWAVTG